MNYHLVWPGVLLVLFCLQQPAAARPLGSANSNQTISIENKSARAYLAHLQLKADQLGLADERQWQRLGHYRGRNFGGWKSDVDDPKFFLARGGKTSPRDELQATLAAFFAPAAVEQSQDEDFDPALEHPQCRFRARYQWLKKALDFDPTRLSEQPCPDFEVWRETINANSATLIFAASYINNPASMFGHTLLRLNRGDDAGNLLTSYVVNFAAEPWTNNPLIYTVLGLGGGFEAYFSVLPFYLKVREYNAMENRDLWEYPLNLNQEEFERMLAHLWEIQVYYIDYFYLDENCSFHLLSLLEAARPSLELSEQFRAFVAPVDTVREVLEVEGLAGEAKFRPAQRHQMLGRLKRLDAKERDLAARLAAGARGEAMKTLGGLSDERQAAVLDAAIARWVYDFSNDKNADTQKKFELLAARSRLKIASPAVEISPDPPPHTAHKTSRLSLGAGTTLEHGGFVDLGFRPALHDLAAPDQGFAPLAQIEFFNLKLRMAGIDLSGIGSNDIGLKNDMDEPTFLLQQLDVIQIMSMVPLEPWVSNWSWALKTGFERVYRDQCPEIGCLSYDLSVGFGGALEFGSISAFALLDGEVALGETFDHFVRLGAGPRLGALVRGGQFWRLLVDARYLYPFLGERDEDGGWIDPIFWRQRAQDSDPENGRANVQPPWRLHATNSFQITRSLEARLDAVWARQRAELGAALHYYW